MADTPNKPEALPSRGGRYERKGDQLQRVHHTKPAPAPHSRLKDEPARAQQPVAPTGGASKE